MRITVTDKYSAFSGSSVAFLAILILSLAFSVSVFRTPVMWFGLVASLISFSGLLHSLWTHALLLQIDDHGIYDRRLGIGKIHWTDVEDVQLQVTENNRFLCFKMANPEPYLARLKGANRERVLFHRSLGFQGFNVDVDAVDVNLLELKKYIDHRVRRSN